MSKEEGDETGLLTIEGETAKLQPLIEELEFRRMFGKEADPLNCFVDIQAGAGGTEAVQRIGFLAEHADRKSTRLNSSHSQISYAVFCLKKKKLLQKSTATALAYL